MNTVVERAETAVMFVRTADEPAEIQSGWQRLEALVSLRGRKFFGAFNPSTREYRACVQLQEGDDPAALGLETGTLPGGRYLRVRLRGEPPEVYERIALDALLENAVKHTGPGDVVELRSRAVPDGVAIEVVDGGSGIPEAALGRIFERFGRADSARNRAVGGVGLGLSIVDAVARAHGGACSVASGERGSTFTLLLPRFQPVRAPAALASST